MSHTLESQVLGHRIDFVLTALENLRDAMRARVESPGNWDEAHLRELGPHLDLMTRLEIELRILRTKNI